MSTQSKMLIWYEPAQSVQTCSKLFVSLYRQAVCQVNYYLLVSLLPSFWINQVADVNSIILMLYQIRLPRWWDHTWSQSILLENQAACGLWPHLYIQFVARMHPNRPFLPATHWRLLEFFRPSLLLFSQICSYLNSAFYLAYPLHTFNSQYEECLLNQTNQCLW